MGHDREERGDPPPPSGESDRQLRQRPSPGSVGNEVEKVSYLFGLLLRFLTEPSPEEFEKVHSNTDAIEVAS